jgi:hypothetical protein
MGFKICAIIYDAMYSLMPPAFLQNYFGISRRGGPMCPPYFWAHTRVRPTRNFDSHTWDAFLEKTEQSPEAGACGQQDQKSETGHDG